MELVCHDCSLQWHRFHPHLEFTLIGRHQVACRRQPLAQRSKHRTCAPVARLDFAVQVRADRNECHLSQGHTLAPLQADRQGPNVGMSTSSARLHHWEMQDVKNHRTAGLHWFSAKTPGRAELCCPPLRVRLFEAILHSLGSAAAIAATGQHPHTASAQQQQKKQCCHLPVL